MNHHLSFNNRNIVNQLFLFFRVALISYSCSFFFADYTIKAQTGDVKSHQKISSAQGGFTGKLRNKDFFGRSICSIGDLDGDGVNDIAVGAPGDDDGGIDRGAVWILFLNRNGSVKSYDAYQKISSLQGNFKGELHNYDKFGSSVTSIGDINGDGITDIAVGAPGNDDGGTDKGAIWILLLKRDGNVKKHIKINDLYFSGALFQNGQFGYSVASLDDLDGDNITDIVVGAPGASIENKNPLLGTFYILFLNTDGTVKHYKNVGKMISKHIDASRSGFDMFGNSVSQVGDINGDGIMDIAVGAMNDAGGKLGKGALWFFFLNNEGTIHNFIKEYQKVYLDYTYPQEKLDNTLRYSYYGSSVTSVGDLDNNGVSDIVVGAMGDNDDGLMKGAIWILFMNKDGTVNTYKKISSLEGEFTGILSNGDYFGGSLAYLGDLDGDGEPEIAVGAHGDSKEGIGKGAVWILSLNKKDTSSTITGKFLINVFTPAANINIFLLAENLSKIQSVTTNQSGIFRFENIPTNKNLILKPDEKAKLTDESKLYLTNEKGQKVISIPRSEGNQFKFRALPGETYNQLKPIADDAEDLLTIDIRGQLYKKLPGDLPPGTEVSIVNNVGELTYMAVIDGTGKFKFKSITAKAEYNFKTEKTDTDVKIEILDKDGKTAFVASIDKKGIYSYERIKPEEAITLVDNKGTEYQVRSGESFVLSNILFKPSRSDIGDKATKELDKLAILLRRNHHITVELSGHTDSKGTAKENKILSGKRVMAAAVYIINKGINAKRIYGNGYGEKQLINHCADGVPCTEEEHARNRRLEVKIIKNQ